MEFWKMAYEQGWIEVEMLRQAVITESNPYGDITKEQYREITGADFVKK